MKEHVLQNNAVYKYKVRYELNSHCSITLGSEPLRKQIHLAEPRRDGSWILRRRHTVRRTPCPRGGATRLSLVLLRHLRLLPLLRHLRLLPHLRLLRLLRGPLLSEQFLAKLLRRGPRVLRGRHAVWRPPHPLHRGVSHTRTRRRREASLLGRVRAQVAIEPARRARGRLGGGAGGEALGGLWGGGAWPRPRGPGGALGGALGGGQEERWGLG